MTKSSSHLRASRILTKAIEKTDKVQEELSVAADNLEQANAVLTHPEAITQVANVVADAVALNVATEAKVQDAVEELETVKELIKNAQVEQSSDKTAGRMGEGSASLLKYIEARAQPALDDDKPTGS
ncbi:hypothetical protein [Caenimonas sp. SL110]|uniref:hypothetical protein n=1 Tax=Caenimonas sp. SL110 TaxID=1450524 RepID=UPI00065325ED|nr:hypothetical protein [Caenimonas sp. SL110]